MKHLIPFILVLISMSCLSQETLSDVLDKFNKETIPYISVEELAMPETKAIILDAREIEEYKVSHIKNSFFVGYDNFDKDATVSNLDNKDQMIVVYCSLGVRSEDIAEKLKKAGYTEVYNLYGGIFEWKNRGFSVFDSKEKETEEVHAFSKEWGKWLKKGKRVY